MLTLPVWPVLIIGGSAPLPFCLDTQTHRHQFCIAYNNSWHEGQKNSYKISAAVMKLGGLEVAISQSMSA